jgi:hypothetical protein
MTQNKKSSTNKLSSYIMLIVLIVLGLAIVALFSAGYAYVSGYIIEAGFLIIVGAFALTISCVVLYQARQSATTLNVEAPKVMTYFECKNCGTKARRDFQRGDFVYKELDACPKCSEQKQMITGIYKEIAEKEKVYEI